MTGAEFVSYGLLLVLLLVVGRRFWLSRTIPQYGPDEAAVNLKGGEVVLLDVRTPGERKQHHIKGSIHIPLGQLTSRSRELEPYKGRTIICYCASGNRSLSAAARLKKLGYQAANLKGGIADWNFHHRTEL